MTSQSSVDQAPVKIIIVGAGQRGRVYAQFSKVAPEKMQVVGVADPNPYRRQVMQQAYQLPDEQCFTDWTEILQQPKQADAVLIATQDREHFEATIAFAQAGYDILVEKPMTTSEEECRQIVQAVKQAKVIFGVCHVLLYTAYTRKLKEVLDAGVIGDIISVQHLEPVGYWHQAHSFVRGNWRREDESTFMLLAKACHDLDWLRYIVGQPCQRVSSFGRLSHFRREHQPALASDRCMTCPAEVENNCPYSAKRFYFGMLERGEHYWPLNVITDDFTPEGVTRALSEGQYGRCVYACDNDVVDHQVVNMEFAAGATVSFTMTAFTSMRPRETRIFGTRGELYSDGRDLNIYDFLTGERSVVSTEVDNDGGILSGHGGGDFGLINAFVEAVSTRDQSRLLSGPDQSLESHLMVFAAEDSRLSGQTRSIEMGVFPESLQAAK